MLDATPFRVDLGGPDDIADDVTLRVVNVNASSVVQVVKSSDNTVLAEQALSNTSAVEIVGSTKNDFLTVDFSQPIPIPVKFIGGGGDGVDSIFVARDANMRLTNSRLEVGTNVIELDSIEVAHLTGGESANTLDASAFSGSADLSGLAGDDVLIGGIGNDQLEGGTGDDQLSGGRGDDAYRFSLSTGAVNLPVNLGSDSVTELPDGGNDTLDMRGATVPLSVDLSNGALQAVATEYLLLDLSDGVSIENAFGGNKDDVLIGNVAANILRGRGGNDVLIGGAGDDQIEGDAGDDRLTGGLGADQIRGGSNFDIVVEVRDANMLLAADSLVIGNDAADTLVEIEKAELTGGASANRLDASPLSATPATAFDVVLNGGGGDDQLIGGPGDDILIGSGGNDQLTGALGNDTYSFDADNPLGSDSILEFANSGIDTLDFRDTTTQGITVDLGTSSPQSVEPTNLSLLLSASDVIENVIGGGGNDHLTGNQLDNVLEGGPGNDVTFGGVGFDTIVASIGDSSTDSNEAYVVSGTGAQEELILEDAPDSDGKRKMQLRGINGSDVPYVFEVPTHDLELALGGGLDTFEIRSLDSEFAGNLIVSGPDDIFVDSVLNTGGRSLTLRAGHSVSIVASINTGGGDLSIEAGSTNLAGDVALDLHGNINVGTSFVATNPDDWFPGISYVGVTQSATSGSGTGMVVDISVDTNSDLFVSIVNPGIGYSPGDQVTFFDPHQSDGSNAVVLTLGSPIQPVTLSTRNLNAAGTASDGASGDIRFHADHILVTQHSEILSDVVGTGAFAPGNIDMTVDEVAGFDVQGFVKIDESVVAINLDDAVIQGGNIELNALANNTRIFFDDDTLSIPQFAFEKLGGIAESLIDLVAGVSISIADARIGFGKNTVVTGTRLNTNAAALSNASVSPIGVALGVAVGIASSTAIVDVAGTISTVGDTILQARTDNTLDVRGDASAAVEFAAGVAVSVLNSTSTVNVEQSATLNVGRDLQIQADNFDRNFTASRSMSGVDGSIGVAVAVSVEKGDTRALLDGTANVGGNVTVNSLHEKGLIQGSKFAFVPAWFDGVHAAAGVNTSSTGDFLDDTFGSAIGTFVVSPLKRLVIFPVVDAIKEKLSKKDGNGPDEQMPFDVGAAVAVVLDTNNVEARIGDGSNRIDPLGDNSVNANGGVSVHARAKNVPDLSAKSAIKTPPTTALGRESQVKDTKFAGSAAIAFGKFDNSARAYVNDGAVVDSGKTLTVLAETRNDVEQALKDVFVVPIEPHFRSTDGVKVLNIGHIVEVNDNRQSGGVPGSWYRYRGIDGVSIDLTKENFEDLNRWDLMGKAPVAAAFNVVTAATNVLSPNFGVEKVFTTWSQATAIGDKVAVAGNVTVLTVNHVAESYISSNAEINRDITLRSSDQDVVVESINVNQAVHFGGNVNLFSFSGSGEAQTVPKISPGDTRRLLDFNKPGAGSVGGEDAVGVSALVLIYHNAVRAEVEDEATLIADSLKVASSNDVLHVSLSASGAQSANRGFNGAATFVDVINSTLAKIDDGARVTVADGSADPVSDASLVVDATDRTVVINAVGGVAVAKNIGLGASFAVNNIERDTRALIGNRSDVVEDTNGNGFVASGGRVSVTALNHGFVGNFALAAAVAADSRLGNSLNSSSRVELPTEDFALDANAKSGVALSGDVSVSVDREKVYAFVSDMAAFNATGLNVDATSDTDIVSVAGAISVALSGTSNNVGLAGSLSSNAVMVDTKAFVENSALSGLNSFSISSLQDGFVLSVTASGSGTPRTNGTAVAGSVSVNIVLDETESFVRGSTITASGEGSVNAFDRSTIWSGAGAAGFGGKNGVGAAVSANLIGFSNDESLVPNRPGKTWAYIENSLITMPNGSLSVTAIADDPTVEPRIVSVAASAGVGFGQNSIGGAGTISVNILKTSTRAFVSGSTIAELADDPLHQPLNTVVEAIDGSGIVSVSGAVGVSQRTSLGAALSYNEIGAETQSYLDNVSLTTDGTLLVDAVSTSVIGGATVGVAVGVGSSKLAAAGSASVNLIKNKIDAHIVDAHDAASSIGLPIHAREGIRVTADDQSQVVSITGGASVAAKGVAVGAAIGYNLIQNEVRAYIEDAQVEALGTSGSIEVSATSAATLVSVSLGVGVGAGNFALGGSLSVNSIANNVDAHIANSLGIKSSGDVNVSAVETATLISVAGGFAGAKDAAVGAAISYTYVGGAFDPANPNAIDQAPAANDHIVAYIDNARVDAKGNVLVRAGFDPLDGDVNGDFDIFGASVSLPDEAKSRMVALTVGAAGAQSVAVGGSISAQVIAHDISARISGNRRVQSDKNIVVDAVDKLEAVNAAGSVAASGRVAVGAVASTQITKNQVAAQIGKGADVFALGSVDVSANLDTHLIPVAGALGASGNVGIGGSILVIHQQDATTASIGDDAKVTAIANGVSVPFPTTSVDANGRRAHHNKQGVLVSATTFTDLFASSVAGGAAGNVGIGGSAIGNDFQSTTSATIGANARINVPVADDPVALLGTQDVRVFAADDTRSITSAGALGVSGTVGVGATTDVELLHKSTLARISDKAEVRASDDVSVEAVAREEFVSATLSAGGGVVGVAGVADVFTLTLDTTAEVGAHATVTAQGNVVVSADDTTSLIQAAGGISAGKVSIGGTAATAIVDKHTRATIGESASVNALAKGGTVSVPTGKLLESFSSRPANDPVSVPAISQPEASDGSLHADRHASAETTPFQGVAVFATSFDRHSLAGFSGGGGIVDARGAGAVETATISTEATVGNSATINGDREHAGNAQGVLISALTDFQHLGLAGGLSGGGAAAVAGADVLILNQSTVAKTGSSANLAASRDIRVLATANEDLASITTTLAGGGQGIAGAASTIKLTDLTLAELGDQSQTRATGNIVVAANDDTDVDIVAGSAAVGIGSVGIGGSVSIVDVTKTTNAIIGHDATVNALANTGDRVTSIANSISADGSGKSVAGTTPVAGLVVQAKSHESILSIGASGSGGAFGSLAGVVTFANLDSNTFAVVGENALINTEDGAGNEQSVHVTALNQVEVLSIAGALSVGIGVGGLAGGVDVGLLHNDTSASIGDGAKVHAKQNIDVAGLSGTKIDSFAASVAAGAVGIAGAVSVYNVGGNLGGVGSRSLDSNSGNGARTSTYVDSRSSAAPMLNVFNEGASHPGNDGLVSARARLSRDLPQSVGSSAFSSRSLPSGTSAIVGANAELKAGADIHVASDNVIHHKQTAGAGQLSLVGIGGSVVVLELDSPAVTRIGDSATLSAANVQPNGTITISSDVEEDLHGFVAAGGVGGLVGIGAQVSILNDHSSSQATTGSGVVIDNADRVDLKSNLRQKIVSETIGATAGGVSVGVSMSRIGSDGTSAAILGAQSEIGTVDGKHVNHVAISTVQNTNAVSRATAVVAGVFSGAGADASVVVTPSVSAKTLDHVQIKAVDVAVLTEGHVNANSDALGVALALGPIPIPGVGVGVSVSNTHVAPVMSAEFGASNTIDASDSVSIDGIFNTSNDQTRAKAVAGAGSTVLAGAGAIARSVHLPSVTARIGDDSTLTTGQVRIRTGGTDTVVSESTGISVAGVAAVGVSLTTADNNPIYEVLLGTNTHITATQAVSLISFPIESTTANSFALAGGILAGQGATATVNAIPTTRIHLEDSSSIIAHDVNAFSILNGDADSLARGISVGGITVGISEAFTTYNPTVAVEIAPNSVIQADGDVKIGTGTNASPVGGKFSTTVSATSDASGGALALSGQGATNHLNVDIHTTTDVGDFTKISAGGDILIIADSETDETSHSESFNIGLIAAVGVTIGRIDLVDRTTAKLGAHVVINAGDEFTLRAFSKHSASSNSITTGGGFVPVSVAEGVVSLHHNTQAQVLNDTQINANGIISIDSSVSLNGSGSGRASAIGFGSGVNTKGIYSITSADTPVPLVGNDQDFNQTPALARVAIGDRAQIRGRETNVIADFASVSVTGLGFIDGGAAGMFGDSNGQVILVTRGEVQVGNGALIRGTEKLQVFAQYGFKSAKEQAPFSLTTNARSQVVADTALQAITSTASNTQLTMTQVSLGTSTLESEKLFVGAFNPDVRFFTDAITQARFIDFGKTTEVGRGRSINQVVTNSTTFNTLRPNPELEIDEQGTIVKQRNLVVQPVLSGFEVSSIGTDPLGFASITVQSPRVDEGQTPSDTDQVNFTSLTLSLGVATFNVRTMFETVDIVNRAPQRQLFIKGLNLTPAAVSPNAQVFGRLPIFTTINANTVANPIVTIKNLASLGNVLVQGPILNPTGTVSITAQRGIFPLGTTANISANQIELNTNEVGIGRDFGRLPVTLNTAPRLAKLSANAEQAIFVDVTTDVTGGNTLPVIDVTSRTGSVDLKILDSLQNGNRVASRYVLERVASAQDVVVNANNTDLLIDDVHAANGQVNLRTASSIRDDRIGDVPSLTARRAVLEAGTGVFLGFVDTLGGVHTGAAVEQLEGKTSQSEFTFVNSGPLVIGGISDVVGISGEAVKIGATGTITVDEPINATFVAIQTSNSPRVEDIAVNSSITATSFEVQIDAGDQLLLNDTAFVQAAQTVRLSSDNSTADGDADGGMVRFAGSLSSPVPASLKTGSGNDLVKFAVDSVFAGDVDLGPGSDTLDYSNINRAIEIDLATELAPFISGHALGVDNVIGTQLDDVLIGNATDNSFDGLGGNDILMGRDGNDRLHGDEGRDVELGGLGADLVDGGDGEDVLDSDPFVLDGGIDVDGNVVTNLVASLRGAFAPWVRTDLTYEDRFAAIYRQFLNAPVGDGASDTLVGSTGLDVFAKRNGDTIVDLEAGEHVIDVDIQITVSLSPGLVREDGDTNLTVVFSRPGDVSQQLTLDFDLSGSATFSSDYALSGATVGEGVIGHITFEPGATTASMTIDPSADRIVEPDETVKITLLSSGSYALGPVTSAIGTIANDDRSAVSVTVSPAKVAEDGSELLQFTFVRTDSSDETPALTARFDVRGTAQLGGDYSSSGAAAFTAAGGTITFGPGESTVSVFVDPLADSVVESDESVVLSLQNDSTYSVNANRTALGTITNDDRSVVDISVNPTKVTEDGGTNMVFMFTRTNTSTETPAMSVLFDIGGTAVFGRDYGARGATTFTPSVGSVNFAKGASTATVVLNPIRDSIVESDETILLTVRGDRSFDTGLATAAGTIVNDDLSTITLSVSSSQVNEDSGKSINFTFNRNNVGRESPALTVQFDVSGSALFTSDFATQNASAFTSTLGSVTFARGASFATLSVVPIRDTIVEPDETVNLTLLSADNIVLSVFRSAAGTIVNDDRSSVDVVVNAAKVAEDGSGNLVYTFSRTNASSETPALTVPFDVQSQATLGIDFSATGASSFSGTSGSVTFAPGASTVTVIIDPSADKLVEPDESIGFSIRNSNAFSIGSNRVATGTIGNDDRSQLSVAVSPSRVAEDGRVSLVYTFTRSNVSSETPSLSVEFDVSGTATFGRDFIVLGVSDFRPPVGRITFAKGVSTVVVTVIPIADIFFESDETVVFKIRSNPAYDLTSSNQATGTIGNDDRP